MVSNSGEKLTQEDQMKLIYIKKVQACQEGNHDLTLCATEHINVYRSYNLYQKLTQYTSYEAINLAEVGHTS
jgi:hypothetical protein